MGNATYKISKIIHLFGLIAWLGPSSGAYLLFLIARLQDNGPIYLWIFKQYINLVHIETAGLITLLISGFTMRIAAGLQSAWWLKKKLAIVFAVFVPLEAAQLLTFHLHIKKALATGGLFAAIQAFDALSVIFFPMLVLGVPAVFFLAVTKPSGKNPEK